MIVVPRPPDSTSLKKIASTLVCRIADSGEISNSSTQQVIVLSRKARSRLRLRNIDRRIFVWLSRMFPSILNAITVVKPETVIRWHRLSRLLALEIQPSWWPSQDRPRDPRPHPTDE
jgi:hypothetical protein